jgi:hypothetical protein
MQVSFGRQLLSLFEYLKDNIISTQYLLFISSSSILALGQGQALGKGKTFINRWYTRVSSIQVNYLNAWKTYVMTSLDAFLASSTRRRYGTIKRNYFHGGKWIFWAYLSDVCTQNNILVHIPSIGMSAMMYEVHPLRITGTSGRGRAFISKGNFLEIRAQFPIVTSIHYIYNEQSKL